MFKFYYYFKYQIYLHVKTVCFTAAEFFTFLRQWGTENFARPKLFPSTTEMLRVGVRVFYVKGKIKKEKKRKLQKDSNI